MKTYKMLALVSMAFCAIFSSAKAETWDFSVDLQKSYQSNPYGAFGTAFVNFENSMIVNAEIHFSNPIQFFGKGSISLVGFEEVHYYYEQEIGVSGELTTVTSIPLNNGNLLQYGVGGVETRAVAFTDWAKDYLFFGQEFSMPIFGNVVEYIPDNATATLRGNYAAPIPEPSSFTALAGVAALGLVALRRRRKA